MVYFKQCVYLVRCDQVDGLRSDISVDHVTTLQVGESTCNLCCEQKDPAQRELLAMTIELVRELATRTPFQNLFGKAKSRFYK